MTIINDQLDNDLIESIENVPEDQKSKAHIIRRNIEEYLEQKALERRLTEVFDEDLNLGW